MLNELLYMKGVQRGMGTTQETILERIGALETRLEYVHPRISNDESTQLEKSIVEFRSALDAEDDVELHRIVASIRRDLKALRGERQDKKRRRWALTYIIDALQHTPVVQLNDAAVDALFDALRMALTPPEPTPAVLDAIRKRLDGAGFEFYPEPSSK